MAEFCAFFLPPLADDCTLFLWGVAAMQQEALDVMATWGFTLKGEIVWLKRTATGKRRFGNCPGAEIGQRLASGSKVSTQRGTRARLE